MATTEKIIVQIHERTNFAQLTTDLQLRELGYESTNKSFNFNTNGGTNLTLWAKQSVNVAFDNAVRIGVSGSSGGAVASSSFNEVVIESSGASGITIMGPDSQLQGISFTSPSQTSGAFIDWSYNNNELLISTNNAGAKLVLKAGTSPHTMTLLSDGKVGIGTESPDGNFHSHAGSAGSVTASGDANSGVFEGSGVSMGISLLSPNSSNQNIYFGSVAGNVKAFQRWNHDTGVMTLATNKTGGQIQFKTNTADIAMTLLSDGKVGIGTDSPSELLELGGQAVVKINLTSNNNVSGSSAVQFGDSDDKNRGRLQYEHTVATERLSLWSGDSERVSILADGKVGIGTESPASELTVYSNSTNVEIEADADFTNGTASFLMRNDAKLWLTRVNGGNSDSFEIRNSTDGINPFIIKTDGTILMNEGKVGIGTDSPTVNLTVTRTEGVVPSLDANTTALIQNNSTPGANVGLTLLAGEDGNVSINFSKTSLEKSGIIDYDNNDDSMDIITNGTLAIRANSTQDVEIVNGNLTVGKLIVYETTLLVDPADDSLLDPNVTTYVNIRDFGSNPATAVTLGIEAGDIYGQLLIITAERDSTVNFDQDADSGNGALIDGETFTLSEGAGISLIWGKGFTGSSNDQWTRIGS